MKLIQASRKREKKASKPEEDRLWGLNPFYVRSARKLRTGHVDTEKEAAGAVGAGGPGDKNKLHIR